jgi:RNA 2',3'-cyclic 3'-phosphodiesterase
MRCFVAVDLSDEAREAIAAAQARLRATAPRAEVGWIDPAKMHLTLEFLGEVAEQQRGGIEGALADVAARHAPFALTAGGAGTFPGPSRPRVLWVGLAAGLREIGLLAADVERACAPLGFPPEGRPFRGHVTLGRVRNPRGVGRVVRALRELDGATFGTWTVREVVLYRSHLGGSRPARYEALARFPLGSAADDG